MSESKSHECPHGMGLSFYCWRCEREIDERNSDPPPKFRTIAKVTPEAMREINRGAEWEFKLEGVAPILPRVRLTLRLSEEEAEALYNHCYSRETRSLVKVKLRAIIREAFGDFMLNLIDATGLPVLILPWGDPMGDFHAEGVA